MKTKRLSFLLSALTILTFVLSACGNLAAPASTSTPAPTNTPQPTATITFTPTNTPRPSPTLRPTKTPDLAATQRIEGFNAETQSYFEKGYLTTTDGEFIEYDDFDEATARLSSYSWWILDDEASDFYMSAHFKWSSAFRNADTSGCGFAFAIQDNSDHYAIFLDRSKIYFVETDRFYRPVGLTRGTGLVKFDNPADKPVEADFTLIVKGTYAYVLVNGEVVGEYTLSKSKILRGNLGLTLLSGTNKDYGTRCEMTNIRAWIPNE